MSRWALVLLAGGLAGVPAVAPAQAPPSLTLEAAVRLAVAHGPFGARIAAERGQAEAATDQAFGRLLPSLAVTASIQRNVEIPRAFLPARLLDPASESEDLVPVRFGADNVWQAGVAVDLPLLDLAALARWHAARARRDAARARGEAARGRLVADVRRAYLRALLARGRERVLAQNVDRLRRALEQSEAFHRAGVGSAYEVAQLRTQLAGLTPELAAARSAYRSAAQAVLTLTGSPLRPVTLVGDLTALDPLATTGAGDPFLQALGVPEALAAAGRLEDRALTGSPTLAASAAEYTAATLEQRATASEDLPRLSAFAFLGLTAQENGRLDFFGERPEQRTRSTYGGLRVEWSGLAFWNRQAARATARQAARDAAATAEIARLTEQVRADSLLGAFRDGAGRIRGRREAVALARQGYEIALSERRAGLGNELQLADAVLALRQAEFQYATAVHDYLSAAVELAAVTGLGSVPGGQR